uniref:Ig-like domain-containing protein n=1 Tax=Vombatus ursinus TaxID=29139 RepID=A0A4X2LYP2_VOMUR
MEKFLGFSLLILWLQLSWVTSQKKVEQSPLSLTVQEGEDAIVNCTYTDTAFNYFFWYHQYHGKGPQLLIQIFSNVATKQDGRFTMHLNKATRNFSLHISASQFGDSGIHFCAASTQCSLGTCSLSQILQLGF